MIFLRWYTERMLTAKTMMMKWRFLKYFEYSSLFNFCIETSQIFVRRKYKISKNFPDRRWTNERVYSIHRPSVLRWKSNIEWRRKINCHFLPHVNPFSFVQIEFHELASILMTNDERVERFFDELFRVLLGIITFLEVKRAFFFKTV